jgi:hypothetical protein
LRWVDGLSRKSDATAIIAGLHQAWAARCDAIRLFGLQADDFVDELAVLKDQQGGMPSMWKRLAVPGFSSTLSLATT